MSTHPTSSWEQALATLTAPDGPFAVVDAEVRGLPQRRHSSAWSAGLRPPAISVPASVDPALE